jgi:hypothetical protein
MADVFKIAEILVAHAVQAHGGGIAIIAYYGETTHNQDRQQVEPRQPRPLQRLRKHTSYPSSTILISSSVKLYNSYTNVLIWTSVAAIWRW